MSLTPNLHSINTYIFPIHYSTVTYPILLLLLFLSYSFSKTLTKNILVLVRYFLCDLLLSFLYSRSVLFSLLLSYWMFGSFRSKILCLLGRVPDAVFSSFTPDCCLVDSLQNYIFSGYKVRLKTTSQKPLTE